jgi:hypothetical protein
MRAERALFHCRKKTLSGQRLAAGSIAIVGEEHLSR